MASVSTPASRERDARARAERAAARREFLRGRGARRGLAIGTAVGLVIGLTGGLLGGVALGRGTVSAEGARAAVSGVLGGDDDETGESTPPVRPAESITLAFGGDVHFENHLAPLARDPDSLAELRSSLGAADLSMVNLETAITERVTPVPGKPFTWRAPAGALDAVAGAGVDVVTMANNHAVDFGDVGLADTLAAVAGSPIPVVGIGRNADEAFAPEVFDVRGVKVAVVSASQVVEETTSYYAAGPATPGIASALPRDRLLRAVGEARQEADVVVAYVHWGLEGYTCPGDEAIAAARDLEEAGADVILGSHAHRVNGAGWLGDAYVHFGLGNFVYYLNREPAGHTGVLTVTLDVPASDEQRPERPLVTEADWDAMLIGGDGIPRRQDAVTTARLQQAFESARECTPARATPGVGTAASAGAAPGTSTTPSN